MPDWLTSRPEGGDEGIDHSAGGTTADQSGRDLCPIHIRHTELPVNGRADRLQKSGNIVYTYPTLLGPSDVQGALVNLAEQRTVIHDVPNAITDLFEANVFAAKNLAQEGLPGAEPERARATDATDF